MLKIKHIIVGLVLVIVIAGAGIAFVQDDTNSGDDTIIAEVEEQAETSHFGSDLIAHNIQRGASQSISGGGGPTFTVWRGSEP